MQNRSWINLNRRCLYWVIGLSSFLGVNSNAQDIDSDFYGEYKNPTEYLEKVIKADSVSVVDTVYVKSIEEGLKLRYAYFNPSTGQINVNLLGIEPEFERQAKSASPGSQISELYKDLLAGVKNTSSELPAMWTHEKRHEINSGINLFGLDFEQLVEFPFWDEVSARIDELLLRRQVYLKTKNIDKAFVGVKFEDSYKSDMFRNYARYLSGRKIVEEVTIKEAEKLLEFAIKDLICDKQLYSQTMPAVLQYKLFKTHQNYLKHFNDIDTQKEKTNWDAVMTQMFAFDNCNIWQLCGAQIFNKQKKKFKKISKEKSFANGIANLAGTYQESINRFAGMASNNR